MLWRTRRRQNRPTLPTILLANVQSLRNKLDDLRARIYFERDTRNCCVFAFTETWLDPSIPDCAVMLDNFTMYRQDRTEDSGKSCGGGVFFSVNSSWATDVRILTALCTPALELLTVKVRPFYLPREFSAVILTVAYIPPQATKTEALDQLYGIINGLENAHPDAASIVLGDFNRANMRTVLPKYYQHISLPTRGEHILDHCYTPFKNCYKPLLRPQCNPAAASLHTKAQTGITGSQTNTQVEQ